MLKCVVVPMDVNLDLYGVEYWINSQLSLKDVFTQNPSYWVKIFKGYAPEEPPSYGVFTKSFEVREFPQLAEYDGMCLHILRLKHENYKFPRNPNALPFESFCNTQFYGPLLVCLSTEMKPTQLRDFDVSQVEQIREINLLLNNKGIEPMPQCSAKKNKARTFIPKQ